MRFRRIIVAANARVHYDESWKAVRYFHPHSCTIPVTTLMLKNIYPAELEERWRTHRGAEIDIRPIRAEDAEIEQEFVRALSPQTRFYRFLDTVKELSPEMLARFTQIDYGREMALIAVHFDAGRETQIGVARYVTRPDGRTCEFAVVVADAWRRHGLGSKLMEKLMGCARAAGLEIMDGDVLGDNHAMIAMVRRLGFTVQANGDDPMLRMVSRKLN